MEITKLLDDSGLKTFKYKVGELVVEDNVPDMRLHIANSLMFNKDTYDELMNKVIDHVYHLDEVQELVNSLEKKTASEVIKILEKNEQFQKFEEKACYLWNATKVSDEDGYIEITCTEDQIKLIEWSANVVWESMIEKYENYSKEYSRFKEMIESRKV